MLNDRYANLPEWVTPYLLHMHRTTKPLTFCPRLAPSDRAQMVQRKPRIDDPGIDGVFSIYANDSTRQAVDAWKNLARTLIRDCQVIPGAITEMQNVAKQSLLQAQNARQCFAIICDGLAAGNPMFWRDYRADLLARNSDCLDVVEAMTLIRHNEWLKARIKGLALGRETRYEHGLAKDGLKRTSTTAYVSRKNDPRVTTY